MEINISTVIVLIIGILIAAIGILFATGVLSIFPSTGIYIKRLVPVLNAKTHGMTCTLTGAFESSIACPEFKIVSNSDLESWSIKVCRDIFTDLKKEAIDVLREKKYLPPSCSLISDFFENEENKIKFLRLAYNYVIAKKIREAYEEFQGDTWLCGNDIARNVICLPYFEDDDRIYISESFVSAILGAFKDNYCPKRITNYVEKYYSESDIIQEFINKGIIDFTCVKANQDPYNDKIKVVNTFGGKEKYVFAPDNEIIKIKYGDYELKEEEKLFSKLLKPRYLCVFIGVDDPDRDPTNPTAVYPARTVVRSFYVLTTKDYPLSNLTEDLKNLISQDDSSLSCFYVPFSKKPCNSFIVDIINIYYSIYDFENTPNSEDILNVYLNVESRIKYYPKFKRLIEDTVPLKDPIVNPCKVNYAEDINECTNPFIIYKLYDRSCMEIDDRYVKTWINSYVNWLNEQKRLGNKVAYTSYLYAIKFEYCDENQNEGCGIVVIHPFGIIGDKYVEVGSSNEIDKIFTYRYYNYTSNACCLYASEAILSIIEEKEKIHIFSDCYCCSCHKWYYMYRKKSDNEWEIPSLNVWGTINVEDIYYPLFNPGTYIRI